MENNNFNKDKFNIYEPLLNAMCSLEDKDAGKLIKLVYGYVFNNLDDDDIFEKKNKDIADVYFIANLKSIKKAKNEQRTNNNIKHVLFYSWYTEVFEMLGDMDAGRLIKKLTDESLGTSYLQGNKYDDAVMMNYKILKSFSRENKHKQNAEHHDFSKIRRDFPEILWDGFDAKKEPYNSVDCVGLYNYLKKHNTVIYDIHILEVIELYSD